MTNRIRWNGGLLAALLGTAALSVFNTSVRAQANSAQPQVMPSGQMITPLAPKGTTFSELNLGLADLPSYTAGQAVKTAISPDGNTLLILTSGFNRIKDAQGHRVTRDSNEYVFVYDLRGGRLKQQQALQGQPVSRLYVQVNFGPSATRPPRPPATRWPSRGCFWGGGQKLTINTAEQGGICEIFVRFDFLVFQSQ